MKKWVIKYSVETIVAIAILVLFATAATVYGGSLCKEDNKTILSTLNKHVPIPPARIVSKREVYGLCEIILEIRGEFVPVYATDQFVLAGELFCKRHPVTQEKIRKIQEKLFISMRPELDKVVAMIYRPDTEKIQHTLYMITDPACPYCHLAEAGIREIAKEHNAVLKVVFFPVHLPEGKEKAIEAICRKLNFQAYIKDNWRREGKTEQHQCEKGKKLLKKSIALGKRLGIRGVPTFYLDNGKKTVGANKGLIEKLFAD